jgi:hypothetical protein
LWPPSGIPVLGICKKEEIVTMRKLAVACGIALFIAMTWVNVSAQVNGNPGQSTALTNQEVIRMVQAGVPASAIVASIRSSRDAKFDLSNNSRAALFAAGGQSEATEMREIWDAMIAETTNGRGGDEAGIQNNGLAKLKSATHRPAAMVTVNRTADPKEAGSVAALKQQKLAAQSRKVTLATADPTGGQSTPGTPTTVGGLPSRSALTTRMMVAPGAIKAATPPSAGPSISPAAKTALMGNRLTVAPCALSNMGPVVTGLKSQGAVDDGGVYPGSGL